MPHKKTFHFLTIVHVIDIERPLFVATFRCSETPGKFPNS